MYDAYIFLRDLLEKYNLYLDITKKTFSKYYQRISLSRKIKKENAIIKFLIAYAINKDKNTKFFIGDVDNYHIVFIYKDNVIFINLKDIEFLSKKYEYIIEYIDKVSEEIFKDLKKIKNLK